MFAPSRPGQALAATLLAVPLLADVHSAPPLPLYGAVDGGPSVLLPNADGSSPYSGIVRYQGRATCTGVFLDTVADNEDAGNAPAYVLTNGHCSDFPGANEVLPDRPAPARHQVIFNFFADSRAQQLAVPVARISHATMKGGDIAVLELAAHYADLVDEGFTPWRPTLTLPERDEPVIVIGAPVQSNPQLSFLRLAACRLAGRAPVVLEYVWHWYDMDRNTCADIRAGSSGSPVISRRTGRLVGLVNTTTVGGRPPYTECTLDHPCEPVSRAAASYSETSYATPVVRIDRCFDGGGRFALGSPGCPLDPGQQVRVAPNGLSAVNPMLASVPIGQPRTRWDVTVSGLFDFYRYAVATLPEQDCRDLRGYGAARRVSERPVIDDPLPTTDGWYFLCVVGGWQSRWGTDWQSVDVPTVVSARVDTVPPRVAAPLTIEENDASWQVTFATYDPEVTFYLFKFGRPSETRCEDAADYRLALVPFVGLPKSGRPYLFCAIPHDSASNRGALIERLLP